MQYDFDPPVLLPTVGCRIRGNRIGFAAALGSQARAIADNVTDDLRRRFRARHGELKIGRELYVMDRLVIGIPNHLHTPPLRLERTADAFEQRDEAGLDGGAAGSEHAAIADAHDRCRRCAEHGDKASVYLGLEEGTERVDRGQNGRRRWFHGSDAGNPRHMRGRRIQHAREQIVGSGVEAQQEPDE